MVQEIKIPNLSFEASKVKGEIMRFYCRNFSTTLPNVGIFKDIEDIGRQYLRQLFLQALENPVQSFENRPFAKCEVSIDKETSLGMLADRLSNEHFGFKFSMMKCKIDFMPHGERVTICFY